MYNYQKAALNLFVTLLGVINLPSKVFAYDFHYSSSETEIINTDFDSSNGWSLNGTTINGGKIFGTSGWGTASYSINPVNLDQGDVFLYWSAVFPNKANTEAEKYYLGLQYADNAPVCYDSLANKIVGTPPCTGTSVKIVDENAEIKVAMRPLQKGNPGNTYNSLYIDPDFDPIANYSPASTRLNLPTIPTTDYRLQISKASSNTYEALLSFWDNTNTTWVNIAPKSTYLPLSIKDSDWIDANRQIESPVTFEAINLQFRKGSSLNSEITALALTQVRGRLKSFEGSNFMLIASP
jgi:hypothetical protein